MKQVAVILIAIFLVQACSKPPSKIAATNISSSEYADLNCSELVRELGRTSERLSAAESSQRKSVAGYAASVFFILIPYSALGGDSEADVAKYKGEKEAIERALSKKNCE